MDPGMENGEWRMEKEERSKKESEKERDTPFNDQ